MLSEGSLFVLFLYISQAVLAFIAYFILRKFYRSSDNKGFRFWSYSWLAWMVHMVGSAISVWNVTHYTIDHPFRLIVSIFTISASFLQVFWLLVGTKELIKQRPLNKLIKWGALILALVLGIILVSTFMSDPEAGSLRVFLRVGVRSLLVGTGYILSAFLLYKFLKSGVGIKLILFSFFVYGLQHLNIFSSTVAFLADWNYPLRLPFFLGSIDLVMQSLMGFGMIINLLELDRASLRKTNKELDTFIYRSSHDLRAPLTTIMAVVDILKKEKDNKEISKLINYIQDRAIRADEVIRDIVHLRRDQKMEVHLLEINVSELTNEIISRYEAVWEGRIKFIRDYKEPSVIYSDVNRLSLVLDNVITNAINFSNPEVDSWIKVVIRPKANDLQITISDNGQGIAPKHLELIFDMFYRANMQSEGSGLGLYMVREALTDISSTIEVKSVQGEGSSFTLNIKNMS